MARSKRNPAPVKLLLTLDEAAAALGMCRATVAKFVYRGTISSIKIGSMRRIPVSALEAFIADFQKSA